MIGFGPRAMSAAVACGVVLIAAAASVAQPVAVEVSVALDDAVRAYRQGVVSERVVVGVRRIPGGLSADLAAGLSPTGGLRDRPERRAEIDAHITGAGHPEGPRVALRMGELRAVLSGGVLAAVHAQGAETYAQETYEEPLTVAALAKLLPPVPLPQLDLALSRGGRAPGSMTPYATGIVWESAVVDSLEHPTRVYCRGRSSVGSVLLVTTPDEGRVLEFACDMGPADESGEQMVLSVRVRPLEVRGGEGGAEEADAWGVNIEGRERVGSLRELAPRRAEAQVGEFVAGIALLTAENRPWTLADAFSAGGGGDGEEGARVPDRFALLLVREGGEGGEGSEDGGGEGGDDAEAPRGLVAAAAEALRAVSERAERDGAWGARWRGVVVADQGVGSVPDRLEAAAGAWGLGAWGLLWSPAAGPTLERFAPGAGAAVVVIGQDRRLVGVVRLDDAGMGAGDVGRAVERLMWPRVEEPAPETTPKTTPEIFGPPAPQAQADSPAPAHENGPAGGAEPGGGGR